MYLLGPIRRPTSCKKLGPYCIATSNQPIHYPARQGPVGNLPSPPVSSLLLLNVGRPIENMHDDFRPLQPKSMQLELPLQRTKDFEHDLELLKGKVGQFSVQIVCMKVGANVRRGYEAHPDAELLCVGSLTIGFVFPMRSVDEIPWAKTSQPFDHLTADFQSQSPSSIAMVHVVTFGDEKVLVAFPFGDIDSIWTMWPWHGTISDRYCCAARKPRQ